jgi:Protein containing tetrapyrrole methyltransferase domain and MazG-like (predicted pyrophosphatase) domain
MEKKRSDMKRLSQGWSPSWKNYGPRDGCPWDREQDFSTLRRYIVEEAYELVEAIEGDGERAIAEESGDLLLQVVFISQIASEKGLFSIRDVLDGICAKLIQRHPHVFGDITVADSEEVMRNWEAHQDRRETKKRVRCFYSLGHSPFHAFPA